MIKMLVVDDDPAWRALYRMGFEGDFEVFEAVDGLHALAALDRVRPDVIVLDLKMPHLDGMGFLRQIERRGLRAPVIVCSGAITMDSLPAIPKRVPGSEEPRPSQCVERPRGCAASTLREGLERQAASRDRRDSLARLTQ